MQTKVGVTIHRREDGHPDLALSDCHVNLVVELVAGPHALAVQERPEAEAAEVVVEQPRHVTFRVYAAVVDEHIARQFLASRSRLAASGAEEVSGDGVDSGGGIWTLHAQNYWPFLLI